ncbi:ribonuclease H-like domain-containing protein [Tanacetum coccineum]
MHVYYLAKRLTCIRSEWESCAKDPKGPKERKALLLRRNRLFLAFLHKKSDLFDAFVFRAYVNNQFNGDIKALQCDYGGEYDNTRFHDLFRQNGIQFRVSCLRTSQQNGKSKLMLRTINNLIRTLLLKAHIPPSYWAEALNMAAHLLNILPSTAINNEIPFTKLFNQTPTYDHLGVFGCLCYPHVDVTHKLQPRSTRCIFLGYPANHLGYRCLDMSTNKIIILRHVHFDEDVFSFETERPSTPPTYDFLWPTATSQPTAAPTPTQTIIPPTHNLLHGPTILPTTPSHNSLPQQTQHSPQPHSPTSATSSPNIDISPITSQHHSAQATPLAQTDPVQFPNTQIPPATQPQPVSTHPMVTRAKAGIFKPLKPMNCHVTTTSPLPRSHIHALRDPI